MAMLCSWKSNQEYGAVLVICHGLSSTPTKEFKAFEMDKHYVYAPPRVRRPYIYLYFYRQTLQLLSDFMTHVYRGQ